MKAREDLEIILLAAGSGTRLGGDAPKCLTALSSNRDTILGRQVANLAGFSAWPIKAVVGYRHLEVRAAHPELSFAENPRYAETNTAKSLLCGLDGVSGRDVLWLNGDVVFDKGIIPLVLSGPHSCMAVNRAKCGDEEIKYVTGADGAMAAVSKQVRNGEGEAVGINLVKAADLELFRECLAACGDRDYFERGLELTIERGLRLFPVDIGDLPCIEIDFPEDLERARKMFS
jgi:L-glutamine-phosphate cytidylyltransferase